MHCFLNIFHITYKNIYHQQNTGLNPMSIDHSLEHILPPKINICEMENKMYTEMKESF